MIEPDNANQDFPPTDNDPIRLDQFLKRLNVVQSGGHAKVLIQNGEVQVNGEVETRRRRKVLPGDVVELDDHQYLVPES